MSDLFARPLGAIQIFSDPNWPTEFSHMETVRFEAHPLIKWLARWLPIQPYVEVRYARYKDCDPLMSDRAVYCSPRQADFLRREIGASQ